MRNILVVPSYKRPHYLLRLLESIEKYVPEIDEVMAVVMPEEADISMFEAKVFHFGLNILKQPQMVCGTARNFVIKKAIEKLAIEDDDIIIITDDDVIFNEETVLRSLYYLPEVDTDLYNRLSKRIQGISTLAKAKGTFLKVTTLPYMFKDWKEYRDYLLEKIVIHKETHDNLQRVIASQDKTIEAIEAPDYKKIPLWRSQIAAILANDNDMSKLKNLRTQITFLKRDYEPK